MHTNSISTSCKRDVGTSRILPEAPAFGTLPQFGDFALFALVSGQSVSQSVGWQTNKTEPSTHVRELKCNRRFLENAKLIMQTTNIKPPRAHTYTQTAANHFLGQGLGIRHAHEVNASDLAQRSFNR